LGDAQSAVDGAGAKDAMSASEGGAFDGTAADPILAPRPVAPLSTATVTSQTPTLHWVLGPGSDGAAVRLCRDRALTKGCTTIVAVGTSARPSAPLMPGVWFWTLAGRLGSRQGASTGPTWEFFVGARSAPIDTSWGTVLDVNGDGFADVAVGTGSPYYRAYVYLGSAQGLGATPTVIQSLAFDFGLSLASAGDVNGDGYADLIVGAYESSAAYVYFGGPAGLGSTPAMIAGPATSKWFGRCAASAGDVNGDGFADVIVGAYGSDTAYVYLGSAGGPAAVPTTLRGPMGGYFGYSVASAGDVNGDGFADVLVGAWNSDATYFYEGSADGVSSRPAVTLSGPNANGGSGYAVASAGDVDGDGFVDVIVGTCCSQEVYVYRGSPNGPAGPSSTLKGPTGDNYFGWSVAGAGDVNGDGFADVIVGDNYHYTVYVYRGGVGGVGVVPSQFTDQGGSDFGGAVSSAGDVNGDGFADVIVGADASAAAYVYFGATIGLSANRVTLTGPTGSYFGRAVASGSYSSGQIAPRRRTSEIEWLSVPGRRGAAMHRST
jgi:VCBS repeat protein/FG-GAP repeat protein